MTIFGKMGSKRQIWGLFVIRMEFQKVRGTHKVEAPLVSWLVILLVKLAPLSCP